MLLRPMTFDDADFLLEMKNYPETRKYAIISKEEIKREDHIEWLKDNIQYFQIIEESGDRVGAMRVQDNEVSIWIDRKFWGNGYATHALFRVSKFDMQAKIVEGNVFSMRAFINAGFKPISFHGTYYVFQK